MMGVSIGDETEAGVRLVTNITPGMPAEAAGLKGGDLLVKIDGVPLNGSAKVSDNLAQKQPGDTVTVVYRREGGEDSEVEAATRRRPRRPISACRKRRRFRRGRRDDYRLAVICVEFPDVKHNDKIEIEDWQESLFSEGVYGHQIQHRRPARSMAACTTYYLEQSVRAVFTSRARCSIGCR